jgi:hypothetical protein
MHRKKEEIRGYKESKEGETTKKIRERKRREKAIVSVKRSKDRIYSTKRENIMKMSNNEIRVMKDNIKDIVSKDKTSKTTKTK